MATALSAADHVGIPNHPPASHMYMGHVDGMDAVAQKNRVGFMLRSTATLSADKRF